MAICITLGVATVQAQSTKTPPNIPPPIAPCGLVTQPTGGTIYLSCATLSHTTVTLPKTAPNIPPPVIPCGGLVTQPTGGVVHQSCITPSSVVLPKNASSYVGARVPPNLPPPTQCTYPNSCQ